MKKAQSYRLHHRLIAGSCKFIIPLLLSLPLAAQSPLLLVCPQPPHNNPAVCTLSLAGPVSAQWNITTSPTVSGITAKSLLTGKSLGLGTNGLMMLFGVNATPLSGNIASVTIPKHSGTLVVKLSNIVASDAGGHAVAVPPAVSVIIN